MAKVMQNELNTKLTIVFFDYDITSALVLALHIAQ